MICEQYVNDIENVKQINFLRAIKIKELNLNKDWRKSIPFWYATPQFMNTLQVDY